MTRHLIPIIIKSSFRTIRPPLKSGEDIAPVSKLAAVNKQRCEHQQLPGKKTQKRKPGKEYLLSQKLLKELTRTWLLRIGK